jgi:hypothetical protein
MDLLPTYTQDSELKVMTAPPLITNHHSTRQAFSSLLSLPVVPQRLLTDEILQLHALRLYLHNLNYRSL